MTIADPVSNKILPSGDRILGEEAPREIRLSKDRRMLTLAWADGSTTTFQAPFLRENSQSAGSKKLRLNGLAIPAAEDLTISTLRPIGAYAVNIVFSDGYDRGIFPWIYLRDLARLAEEGPRSPALTPNDFLKGN